MLFVVSIESLQVIEKFVSIEKSRKYHTSWPWPPSIVCSKCKYENKKIFKEEESNEMLKILDLVNSIEECQKIWNHVWRKHESII